MFLNYYANMTLLTAFTFLVVIFASGCQAVDSGLGDRLKTLPNDGLSPELAELISDMAYTIDTLNKRVVKLEGLEGKVERLERELVTTRRRMANMKGRIKSSLSDNANSQDTSESSMQGEQNIDRQPPSKSKRQIQQPTSPTPIDTNRPAVAFSAVLTNTLTHVHAQHTIAFEDVLLNEGQGYDVTSGIFTAPVAGIYLFIYNLGHWGADETMLELMKGGHRVNAVAIEGSISEQNLQGGNAAILHLNQGDNVWVEMFFKNDASAQNIYTTFSGAILF